jgi:filamentous hemagglutinin family protein
MKKIITIFFLSISAVIFANPNSPVVVNGSATFLQNNNILNINCIDKTIINWDSFSIENNEVVNFIQPFFSSVVLNRVLLQDPSIISGILKSNGSIFLLNPNGIIFSKDSKIDCNSFLASTLNIKDKDFINDNLNFYETLSSSIVNLGNISAIGDIYLLSKNINNKGEIISSTGRAFLVSASNIVIKPNDSECIYITSNINIDKDNIGIDNSGLIKALKTHLLSDGNAYEMAIKHTGKIKAISKNDEAEVKLISQNGKIVLQKDSLIIAKNEMNGGDVKILGNEIFLEDLTFIDVSNSFDGGNVYIGGGKQGKDSNLFNSNLNVISKDVQINASSKITGNGGDVILWSDGITFFQGSINTNGGNLKGDGGFIEVSGLKKLYFEGLASTFAVNGTTGTLLLDPNDITISTAASASGSFDSGSPNTWIPTATPSNILFSSLVSNLILSNVLISTSVGTDYGGSGDITFSGALTSGAMTGAGYTLTLNADRDILITGATTFSFPAGGNGKFNFTSNRDINISGALTSTNLSGVSFTATTGQIINSAAVSLSHVAATTNSPLVLSAGTNINFASTFSTTNLTGASLTATSGQITNSAAVTLTHQASTSNGSLTLSAGTDISLGSSFTATNLTGVTFSAGNDILTTATTSALSLTSQSALAAAPLVFSAGNNITFNGNATTFTNQTSATLTAGNIFQIVPLATQTFTFSNIFNTISITGDAGVIIGQNGTAFNNTINFGNAAIVNISTTDVNTDITLGGAGAGAGDVTINGGSTGTFSLLTQRDIIFNGGALAVTTIQGFGTANLAPAGTGLIKFLTPITNFTSINSLVLNPYDYSFSTSAFTINITNTPAASITNRNLSGFTFPDVGTLNFPSSYLDISAESIVVNGKIIGTSNGSISITSNGDMTVESITSTFPARIGLLTGDITLNVAGNLYVIGEQQINGAFTNGFAQIGYDQPSTISDIYLTVGGNILVKGGLSTSGNCFGIIGHGGKALALGTRQGDIIFNSIGGDVTLEANDGSATPISGFEGAAHIGHFVIDPTTNINFIGDIRGSALGSRAVIPGFLDVDGGVQDQATALIGHGASNVAAGSVDIRGNILIQCDSLELDGRTATTTTGEAYAGIGHKIRYSTTSLTGNIHGSVDVKVIGNALMIATGNGGAAILGAYSSSAATISSSSDIDMTLVNLEVGGYLTALGGTIAPSSGIAENKCIIGVYSELLPGFTTANTKTNLNITVGKDFSFVSRFGDPSYISGGQIYSQGYATNINVDGDFYIQGELKSAALISADTLNMNIGRNLSITNKAPSPEKTYLQAENTIYIEVGSDLFMDGYCITSFGAGNGGYGYILNNAGSSAGEITILVGHNLHMNPITKIQNNALNQPITIVVDNQYPDPPELGEHHIEMKMHSSISTKNNSAPIRLFSSEQSLYNIAYIDSNNYARINGQPFIPGAEFVDTSQEKWGIYYPSLLGGVVSPFFTFFYKNSQSTAVNPATNIVYQRPLLVSADFEMFFRPFYLYFRLLNDNYYKKKKDYKND